MAAVGTKFWLLAEDNEFIALLSSQMLRSALPQHYKAILVRNGDEALKAIRHEPFEAWDLDETQKNLIKTEGKTDYVWQGFILDCGMPYSGGESKDAGVLLAKEIRRIYQKNVHVFSCSSDHREEFSDRELFDGELPKNGLLRAIPAVFSRFFPGDFTMCAQL